MSHVNFIAVCVDTYNFIAVCLVSLCPTWSIVYLGYVKVERHDREHVSDRGEGEDCGEGTLVSQNVQQPQHGHNRIAHVLQRIGRLGVPILSFLL
jgi:hypothetical protein